MPIKHTYTLMCLLFAFLIPHDRNVCLLKLPYEAPDNSTNILKPVDVVHIFLY